MTTPRISLAPCRACGASPDSPSLDQPHTCSCGWRFPRGLQLVTGGMDTVLLACGQCGAWHSLTTSERGGWALAAPLREQTPALDTPEEG